MSIANIAKKFVQYPASHEIAGRLNLMKSKTCEHDRATCYLKCGVKLNMLTNVWTPIRRARRIGWMRSMAENEPS